MALAIILANAGSRLEPVRSLQRHACFYAQLVRNIFDLLIPLIIAWILVALMPLTTEFIQATQ
jgi:hypothetical protein